MKKEAFLLLFPIPLVLILVLLRPQLIEFSRFKNEWPPWSKTEPSTGRPPVMISSAKFPDRVIATEGATGQDNFFRGNILRSGSTPHAVPIQLKLAWSYPNLNIGMHGASKATPAVDETGVYIGGDSAWFYAFDLDGTLRWKFHIAASSRGFHSTAFLHAGRVCVGGYNGTFYCLNKLTGDVVWSMSVPMGGFGASPMILDKSLIAAIETSGPVNAFVIKASLESGQLEWQSDWLGEQSHSSPAYDPKTNSIYLGANNNFFFSLSQFNGEVNWRTDLGGPVKDTPLIGGKCILTTSWSRKLFCLDPQTGKPIWETPLLGRSQSSPTYVPGSGVIIVGDSGGGITGVDSRNGQVLWQRATDLVIQSSALAARYPGSETWIAWMACGKTKLCALNPSNGKSLAEYELPASLSGVPVAYEGSLYLALNYPGGLLKLSP